jgi:hypothetical protein
MSDFVRAGRLLCVAIYVASLACPRVLADAVKSQDGLVARYSFDEGQGAVLYDSSGHGNDGKIQGGVEWVKFRRGYALRFNGLDASEDYRARILTYPDDYTQRYFPGYDEFCRYLAGTYVDYYGRWSKEKARALKAGIRGTHLAWEGSTGISAPLMLDFSRPPHNK